MIANVLILVSLVMTLLGIMGIREHSIKKRMTALFLATAGGLGIAFSQMGSYGLLSGLQQLPFRIVGLLSLWLLMSSVCKKNQLVTLEDLNGLQKSAPYTYGLMVLMALMLIGVPGTGTFIGIMYAQMGYMYSYPGVFSYVGMLGNVLAMVIIAMIVFPMLREAFLFGKKDGSIEKRDIQPSKTREKFEKPPMILQLATAVMAVGLLVLSVWQGILTSVVTKIVESVM